MPARTLKDWYARVDFKLSKNQLAHQRKSVSHKVKALKECSLLEGRSTHRLWYEVERVFRKMGWWNEQAHFLWEMVPPSHRLPFALEPTSRALVVLFEGYNSTAAVTSDGEGLLCGAQYPRISDAWILDPVGMLHCLPHDPYEQPFSLLVRYKSDVQNLLEELGSYT